MSDKSIRISHPVEIAYKSIKTSGKYELQEGKLKSYIDDSPTPGISVISIKFESNSFFNCIQFDSNEKESDFMPNTFRIEISDDGEIWEPIIKEYEYSKVNRKQCKWNFSMIQASYVKIVIKFNRKTKEGKYRTAFSNFKVMIAGIEKIIASSENDRFWVKENLIDSRDEYGWSSKEKDSESEEYLVVDLGSINRVDEVRLLSRNDVETNFPESFYFYYSEDDLSWHHLHEEPQFMTEPLTWYKWKFFPTNIRFFKILCNVNKPNSKKKYLAQIVELEIYADSDISAFSKKRIVADTPPYASIMRPGVVRLGADGETKEGLAVQGSDRRLRDATTDFKGIVELASDGEDRELVVVQGNDKRLKPATELNLGLVRLSKNLEVKEGLVVQSNDERLQSATTDKKGIVELAEDGETRQGVVVQGNDKRLKKSTTKDYGLVILAELNEDTPGKVITANDPRIKKATTEKEGILRFAMNGEDAEFAAVQGNDKRLKKATTQSFGIIELAKSGENIEGKVVQGNDRRIQLASTDEAGIVVLANHGFNTSGKVVQADDPRLSDSREAKPHSHDYAPLKHSFDSHTGNLNISGETSSPFKNISIPLPSHSIIYSKNNLKGGSAITGVGVDEGVLGFSEEFGVLGLSTKENFGAGIAGFSKNGFGGFFCSEKNYAIYIDSVKNKSRDIQGSGLAIHAEGKSEFNGNVRFFNETGSDCIAKYFRVNNGEIISKGDLVIISDKDNSVSKSRTSYSNKVLGVCVDSSAIEIGSKDNDGNFILIAVFGLVKLNVDASEGSITFGDLLVSGLTPGYCTKADSNKIKHGSLVAKSLGELKKDKGQITAILALS